MLTEENRRLIYCKFHKHFKSLGVLTELEISNLLSPLANPNCVSEETIETVEMYNHLIENKFKEYRKSYNTYKNEIQEILNENN